MKDKVYKSEVKCDLDRVSYINTYLRAGTRDGYVEVLDRNLDIGEVGDAMIDGSVEQYKAWLEAKQIVYTPGPIITARPDEYVNCIDVEPFYLIKKRI